MNRVFGKKKQAAPAPSLGDTSSNLGGRVNEMDAKIESLESELRAYKDKIKKSKSPAAKKQLQKRAMEVLKRKRMYEQQRDVIAGQQFNIDQARYVCLRNLRFSFGWPAGKAFVRSPARMCDISISLKALGLNRQRPMLLQLEP